MIIIKTQKSQLSQYNYTYTYISILYTYYIGTLNIKHTLYLSNIYAYYIKQQSVNK